MTVQAPMDLGAGGHDNAGHGAMAFAVVGMACRFPGSATSPEKLWEMLQAGRSAWTPEPPDGRFHMSQFYDPQIGKMGSLFTKGAHFLKEDVSLFDRKFFNISATEASAMDPQIRLLLEIAFETFENAGCSMDQLANSQTGVFVGSWSRDYHLHLERDPENAPMYESTGTAASIVSNRISHFFDLKGPSFTVDTACSSSLVALHQALLSLKNGDAERAFVGGVNLILDPTASMALGRMRLLSPDGRSYAFDERANGYGRGEGVGGIFLKPLRAAQRDGDTIRAIIRSSAVNQDGYTPGITLPSADAQESAIRRAYEAGGLEAEADFVECHGTGTAVGDPIETRAVASVLAQHRDAGNSLTIGSIKSNIGHLEAAAGIAGIIKSILMLERGTIPPQALLQNPTKAIDWRTLKLKPSQQLHRPSKLNRISLNSFGFGGANAHVVIDKAPLDGSQTNGGRHEAKQNPCLAIVTGNCERSCKNVAAQLSRYIVEHPELEESDTFCRDLAFSLSRRTMLEYRVAFTYSTVPELLEKLDHVQCGTITAEKAMSHNRTSFVFTGQGAQWHAMARELLQDCDTFRCSMDRAASTFKNLGCQWDLVEELLKSESKSKVSEPDRSQPICTAIQISIVDVMRTLEITPCAVVGHSSGEMAAAYAAGAISFEDALKSAYYRGLLVSEAISGGTMRGCMLAVGLDASKTEEYINQLPHSDVGLCIVACHNSPSSVTVSGDEDAVLHLHKLLQREQIFSRLLKTNGAAYHSHHMRTIAQKLSDALASNNTSVPNLGIKWISTVTASDRTDHALTGEYWVQNLVSPVLFPQALERACRDQLGQPQIDTIVEIGPHSALAGPIKQTLKSIGMAQSVRYTNALTRNENSISTFLNMIGALALRGQTFNLAAVHQLCSSTKPTYLANLPSYPWEHDTRYWHDSRLSAEYRSRSSPRHELLGVRSPDFNASEPSWRNYVRLSDLAWLKGHEVQGQVIWPGAGFIAMAVEAVKQVSSAPRWPTGSAKYVLRDVVLSKALVLREDSEDVEINFKMRPQSTSATDSSNIWNEFRVFTLSKGKEPQEHCRGLVAIDGYKTSNIAAPNTAEISDIVARSPMQIDPADFYRTFRQQGMAWRNAFAGLTSISAGPTSAFCSVRQWPETTDISSIQNMGYVHPGTLDSLFQASFAPMIANDLPAANVITGIDHLEIVLNGSCQSSSDLEVYCESSDRGWDIGTVPNDNAPFSVRMKGFQITEVAGEMPEGPAGQQTCFNVEWTELTDDMASNIFPRGNLSQSITYKETGLMNGAATDQVLINGVNHDSSLVNELSTSTASRVQIIGSEGNFFVTELSSELREVTNHEILEAHGWEQLALTSDICVLIDISQPSSLISNMPRDIFHKFQSLIRQASNILWITAGAADECTNPGAASVSGFAATIRVENPALRLVTLDIDRDAMSTTVLVPLINQMLRGKHFDGNADVGDLDFELAYHNGQWRVPRIVVNEKLTNFVIERGSVVEPQDAPLYQDNRPLSLAPAQPGLIDTLRWQDQQAPCLDPGPDEVIFETRAHGVNFRDLLVSIGQLGTGKDAVMAGECSGIVTAVGSNLKAEFTLGDRVCAFGAQPYPNFARVPGHRCIKVPESVSLEVAASIPIVYSTVVYALLHVAQIERGSKVLIHSASGGVGQAAVMLAHHVGAEVFATVGNADKKKLLIDEFGVSEDHIFSSRDTMFQQQIMKITNGSGVDMVLNSLTGEMFRESCNCLGNFGHFVEIGKRDLIANSRMEMRVFLKNASFTAMDLMVIGKQKPNLCKRLLTEAMQYVASGALKPIKMATGPLSDITTTFRQMQAGKHVGKIVLTADRNTHVKIVPPPRKGVQFNADASYLVVGGLGGLGRTMIRWMAARGAKHIVTMSRTGSRSTHAASFISEMQARGVTLQVLACNVADAGSVESALNDISESMPPVRGLIQAAMVLQDSIFEQMTYEQWKAATQPKIQGTQNLHDYFVKHQKDLDFFILFSSVVSVVGNAGQAAYGAANSYLDGLARYRNSQGLSGHSINVGVVSDAGVVSRNDDLAKMLASRGYSTITVNDLLNVLDQVICESKPTTPILSQTVMGLGTDARALRGPKFAKWLELAGVGKETESQPGEGKNDLRLASTPVEAMAIAIAALGQQLGKLLSIDPAGIEASQTLASYGIDSLISVELRNWIRAELKAAVPLLELNESGRTVGSLAGLIVQRSSLVQGL